MQSLYVIEGTSNSGKTTTSKILDTIPNISIIPEFMDHPLSPKPAKNLEEELKNQKIFLEIEKERMEQAKALLLKNQIVFLERSFLSILSVSYALQKLGKYYGYTNALNLYNSMINESWYIHPETIYILTSSYEEKIKRNKTREKELKENWLEEKFEIYQNEFYRMKEVESNKVFIDTSNKQEEYAAKVIQKSLKVRR